jgi:hypothetical protein
MIGPVSGTGRAMMSSLQQAMSKGMPADQAIQYVKSMAQQGVAPLVDLYAMMKQFERLKQPPQPMPQGGTIRDQLNALEQGMDQGGGMPQAMGQGIAGLNAGSMENPQFAGGGIVAFQQGGVPTANIPKTWEEVAAADQARLATLEGGTGQDAYFKEQEEIRRKLGIGEFGQAKKLREESATRLGREAGSIEAEEDALNQEQYWGDVASYGAEAGATLLTSLSKAKKGSAERKRASKERVRNAVSQAEQAKILLAEAEEARKSGDMSTYNAKMDKVRSLARESTGKVMDEKFKVSERKEEQKGRERLVGMEIGSRERLQKMENDARIDLEVKRGEIEERVRTNTATPADMAGLDYLRKAQQFGEDDSRTQAALTRYLNIMSARSSSGLGSLTAPPPLAGGKPAAAPAAQGGSLPSGFVED